MKNRSIILLLIMLALAASLIKLVPKVRLERMNQTALLAVDYEDARTLAELEGEKLSSVLGQFKNAGAGAVILREDTLYSLEKEGQLSFFTSAELKNLNRIFYSGIFSGALPETSMENICYLVSGNPALLIRVKKFLGAQLGEKKVTFFSPGVLAVAAGKYQPLDLKRKTGELELDFDFRQSLGNIGVGVDPLKAEFLTRQEIEIIPLMVPGRRLGPEAIREKLATVKNLCPRAYCLIYDDDYVAGYPDNLSATAAALKNENLALGFWDMTGQKGAAALGRLINDVVIPVHTVSRPEIRQIPESQLASRYVRAVRERGVRILDLHLIFRREINPDLIALNVNYVSQVKNALEKTGVKLKKKFLIPLAHYPIKIPDGFMLNTLFVAGVAAAFFWLLGLLGCPTLVAGGLTILVVLTYWFLQLPEYETAGRQFLSWVAAVTAASLSLIVPFSLKIIPAPEKDFLRRLAAVMGISLAGGLVVAGLLASPDFMLKINLFAGVKLFLVLPFLLFVLYVRKSFYPQVTLKKIIRKIWNLELKMGGFMLVVGGLLVAGLILLRSGNDFRQAVPGWELKLRNIFENYLVARPRSKEILLGYPALFLSLLFFKKYFRSFWFWLMALAGGLVPVSIINSFCHAHTPLTFTLLRTFNGFWLGLAVFLIIYWLARKFYQLMADR